MLYYSFISFGQPPTDDPHGPTEEHTTSLAIRWDSAFAFWFLWKMVILILLFSVVFIERSVLLEGQ